MKVAPAANTHTRWLYSEFTPGLRSLCRILRSWMCFMARDICTNNWSASPSLISRPLRLLMNWSKSPPNDNKIIQCTMRNLLWYAWNSICIINSLRSREVTFICAYTYRRRIPWRWRVTSSKQKNPKSQQCSDDSIFPLSLPPDAFAWPL